MSWLVYDTTGAQIGARRAIAAADRRAAIEAAEPAEWDL
jgi:hypothetical protein